MSIANSANPYSSLKLFYHTEKINDILAERRTAPIYLRIKPTNRCNQNCYYCGSQDDNVPEDRHFDRKATLEWEIMKKLLNDLVAMKVKAVTFSGGGEPLIYPNISDCLQFLRDHKIDYSVITNGQALAGKTAELLGEAKWVRVSLESADSESYRQIRGVDTFDKVIENIKSFCETKTSNCVMGINCVITQDNYKKIYDLCQLAHSIGVDNIKFSPLRIDGDIAKYHEKMVHIVNGQIKAAIKDFASDGFVIIDKYSSDLALLKAVYQKKYRRCLIQEIFAVIGADGKVYRCHQRAYTSGGDIGDLKNKSFQDIWFSKEVIEDVRNLDACKECAFRCVFDGRNELLNDLVCIDKNHVNFI